MPENHPEQCHYSCYGFTVQAQQYGFLSVISLLAVDQATGLNLRVTGRESPKVVNPAEW